MFSGSCQAMAGALLFPLALSGCTNGSGESASDRIMNGQSPVAETAPGAPKTPSSVDSDQTSIAANPTTPSVAPVQAPPSRTGCAGGTADQVCLGLKYIAYLDGSGAASVSEAESQANIAQINKVWKACDIQFQIDEYATVNPGDYGLQYSTAYYSELTDIRDTFSTNDELLVVTTGTWSRSGSLGNTGANAWTMMPSSHGPYGAILEKPVATYTNIIAHEIGHYLNLDHAEASARLMNPVIYTTSTTITAAECDTARSAARYYWSKVLR